MRKKLKACAVLTSLGFAFFSSGHATAESKPDASIEARLARLHAAQDAGHLRIEIVGKLQDTLGTPDGTETSEVKTADWLQTWKKRFSDNGSPA